MQGSITIETVSANGEDAQACIEGGEIKSSAKYHGIGVNQLNRRFLLLAFVLPLFFPSITRVLAKGGSMHPIHGVGDMTLQRNRFREVKESLPINRESRVGEAGIENGANRLEEACAGVTE
ncbi:hypothetical protein BDZ91DRAFT_746931 [Kalaharituber pfeilii]|nr:hypothetical protein BDZ91DRAFT_746931 [Kalaharituber pfeilii]